jgi:hypothetical protein
MTHNISSPQRREPAAIAEQPSAPSVEERLTALEGAAAKGIVGPTGPVGPRGAAGDASYAIREVNIAFEKAIARSNAESAQREDAFRKEIEKLRKEVSAFKAHIHEHVKEHVACGVSDILEEYHVLKNGAPSSEYFAHEIRQIVREELKK